MSTILDNEHKYIIDGELLGYLYQLGNAVSRGNICNCLLLAGQIAQSMTIYEPKEFKKD